MNTKTIIVIVLGLFLAGGLFYGLTLAGYGFSTKVVAPLEGNLAQANAEAQNKAFKSSIPYIESRNTRISQYIYQYKNSKDEVAKAGILSEINDIANEVLDKSKLSSSNQSFLQEHGL